MPLPPPVAIATVKFTDPGTVRVGTQIQITAIARDAAGQVVSLAGENLRYFSFNARVATVTTSGLVTAIAPGSAEIGTTVRNTSYRVMVVVTD